MVEWRRHCRVEWLVPQKGGCLHTAESTGLLDIHSCKEKWARCIHDGGTRRSKRDVGKGRPRSVGHLFWHLCNALHCRIERQTIRKRLWAYIFVFCIIPIIIRLDCHVQPHKIEL